jgi:hypothetical protein
MRTKTARLWLTPVLGLAACQTLATSGQLIDRYHAARCVEPGIAKGVTPPTRGWDTTVKIAGGSEATITGADMVGGSITIRFASDGQQVVAVRPRDYIYPNDVRIDDSAGLLYVKAGGLAGGIFKQTWLYAYDLRGRQQVSRRRVEPAVLPAECAAPPLTK